MKIFSNFFEERQPINFVMPKAKIKLVLIWIFLGNLILNVSRKILYKKNAFHIQQINKILVFRTGSIGDTICTFPSFAAIKSKFPNAVIDILSNAGSSKLVSVEGLLQENYFNEIIDYLGINPTLLWKKIRKNNYDLVIQLPQQFAPVNKQLRDIFFFRTAGIKYGFGWQKSSSHLFKKTQEKYLLHKNEAAILLDILNRNNIDSEIENLYPLNIKTSDKSFVESEFEMVGIDLKKAIVGIIIGAKRPQNRWPVVYFGEVIKYLVDKKFQILIIGGKDDQENANKLLQNNVWSMCGKLTPMQSAVALSFCKLAISNDTGPMHLSYAVKTPVLAIFSSRDFPGRWFPPHNMAVKIFRNYNVSCSLCLTETCSDNICMKGIYPADVINFIETSNFRNKDFNQLI